MKDKQFDVTGAIIDYESGDMLSEDVPAFFQHLINTGLAWSLQGSYGRMARTLIAEGLCASPSGKVWRREVAS